MQQRKIQIFVNYFHFPSKFLTSSIPQIMGEVGINRKKFWEFQFFHERSATSLTWISLNSFERIS